MRGGGNTTGSVIPQLKLICEKNQTSNASEVWPRPKGRRWASPAPSRTPPSLSTGFVCLLATEGHRDIRPHLAPLQHSWKVAPTDEKEGAPASTHQGQLSLNPETAHPA